MLSKLTKSFENLSKLPPGAIRTLGAAQERPRGHICCYSLHFDQLRTALNVLLRQSRPSMPHLP